MSVFRPIEEQIFDVFGEMKVDPLEFNKSLLKGILPLLNIPSGEASQIFL